MKTVLFHLDNRPIRFEVMVSENAMSFRPVEYLFRCIYPEVVLQLKEEACLFENNVDPGLRAQIMAQLSWVWNGRHAA